MKAANAKRLALIHPVCILHLTWYTEHLPYMT